MFKCTLALIGLIGTTAEIETPVKLTRSYRQQFDDIDALLGRLTHDIKKYYCEEHSRQGNNGSGEGLEPKFLEQHLFPLQYARNIPFRPEDSTQASLKTAKGTIWKAGKEESTFKHSDDNTFNTWLSGQVDDDDEQGITATDLENGILSDIYYSVFTHEIEMDEFGNGEKAWNAKADCVSWDPNICQHFPTIQLALYFDTAVPEKITFKPKDAATFVFWTPTADSCRDEEKK